MLGLTATMTPKHIARRLLLYEAVGFAVLVTVSWLDELLDLPSLLFGGAPGHNWREAALETTIILAAAVPTILLNRGLALRLIYLEDFLRVCGWCRKIAVEDKWISMESYFDQELKVTTTHGMCPECFKNLQESLSKKKRDEEGS